MSYEDIIRKDHHVSQKHPRMSMLNRAAQFSSFAALTGYEEAVKETARHTDDELILDESQMEAVNEALTKIGSALDEGQRPRVRITWFMTDDKKSGGVYVTSTDVILKIDPIEHIISTSEGEQISIDHITEIELPEAAW